MAKIELKSTLKTHIEVEQVAKKDQNYKEESETVQRVLKEILELPEVLEHLAKNKIQISGFELAETVSSVEEATDANEQTTINEELFSEEMEAAALKFFYNSVITDAFMENSHFLSSTSTPRQDTMIKLLTTANQRFQKEHSNFRGNFWKLLDQAIFSNYQKRFQNQENSKKEGLGLLKIAATEAACHLEVFKKAVSLYQNVYNDHPESPLKVLDYDQANILHTVCSFLVSKAEEGKLTISDWDVYNLLISKDRSLLTGTDETGSTPSELLENAELKENQDYEASFAVSRQIEG